MKKFVFKWSFFTKLSALLYLHPGWRAVGMAPGRRVIYAAESIPLAFMESMIRRKGTGFNDEFRIMIIEVPDTLTIAAVDSGNLAPGWRDFFDCSICQAIGNDWCDKGLTPVLKVPSAVLTTNFDMVINSSHPDFKQILLLDATYLVPDERIENILKKYPVKL